MRGRGSYHWQRSHKLCYWSGRWSFHSGGADAGTASGASVAAAVLARAVVRAVALLRRCQDVVVVRCSWNS
jgi:hypothetical protein